MNEQLCFAKHMGDERTAAAIFVDFFFFIYPDGSSWAYGIPFGRHDIFPRSQLSIVWYPCVAVCSSANRRLQLCFPPKKNRPANCSFSCSWFQIGKHLVLTTPHVTTSLHMFSPTVVLPVIGPYSSTIHTASFSLDSANIGMLAISFILAMLGLCMPFSANGSICLDIEKSHCKHY